MITLRKATDRFHTQIDWLDSWHTFSFGHHHDPKHMGFGPLRVINDDRIMGGEGFPTHGHRDMEIITVVLDGALAHKDSIGTGSVITPGDVQKMSAGSGIEHSEFNASETDPVHLLQIWIMPNKASVKPAYQQIHFAPDTMRNQLRLVAAPMGEKDVISLYQDARMYVGRFDDGKAASFTLAKGRKAWVHLATGVMEVQGKLMREGDGLAVEKEDALTFAAKAESTVLLFDVD